MRIIQLFPLFLCVHNLHAATLYVDAARPDDRGDGLSWATATLTIQAAVNAAQPGDAVLVTNGVYAAGTTSTPGQALLNRVVITNGVIVRSVSGPASTVIEGSGTTAYGTSSAVRCVFLSKGRLEGFTLRYGETGTPTAAPVSENNSGGGLRMKATCPPDSWASNCVIANCRSTFGGGAAFAALYDCSVRSNKAVQGGGCYSGTVSRCVLAKNTATSTGGGAFYGPFSNCVLWGNTSGVTSVGAFQGTFFNCTIANNSASSSPGGCYYGAF
jgi:hypothetical protein